MSASVSHSRLTVRYFKDFNEDGGKRETGKVETLEDGEHHIEHGSQKAEPHRERNREAVRRSCFRGFTVTLVGLYLLILVGIVTRYVLLTLENEQLQRRCNNLRNDSSLIQDNSAGKLCPEGWKKFGCSCYFKSTEEKIWFESRDDCRDRGSDLVIINSKEEQEFIANLSMTVESWIGLTRRWTNGWKWEWVDRSPLTETLRAPGELEDTSYWSYVACCNNQSLTQH
uniref:C-type lectin domain-containing protein n=2 Tax=Anabas testudineus TaxID=64144 RepID=A0A7N6ADJ7_ANATE